MAHTQAPDWESGGTGGQVRLCDSVVHADSHLLLLNGDPQRDYTRGDKPSKDATEATPLLAVDDKPAGCVRCYRCSARIVYFVLLGVLLGGLFFFYIFPRLLPVHTPNIEPARKSVPDTPDPPTLGTVGGTFVTLSWKPLFINQTGGSSILRYEVATTNYVDGEFVGELVGNHSMPNVTYITRCMTGETKCNVTQLLGGLKYVFEIRAVNSLGPSNYSQPLIVTTAPAERPTAPGPPEIRRATTNELSIAWSPSFYNGAYLEEYVVEMEHASGDAAMAEYRTECIVRSDTGHSLELPLQCTIKHLWPGWSYSLRVYAVNSAGVSAYSSISTIHTNHLDAKKPHTMTTPVLLDADSDYLDLQWTAPEDGGSQIIAYEVEYRANYTSAFRPGCISHSLQCRLGDLLASTTYCLRIRANNSVGEGDWSSVSGAACFPTASGSGPDPPKLDPLPQAVTSLTITAHWNKPDNHGVPISAYELQRDDWWVDGPLATVFKGLNQSFEAQTHMLPATKYNFRVRAINRLGASNWSSVVSYTTDIAGECGNPADVAAYKRTKTTMKGDIQHCLIKCATSGYGCAVSCIQENVGLSKGCAQCWATEGECTLQKCLGPCTNPGSSGCKQCSEDKCFPGCVQCSGIPRYFFPP